MHRHILGLTTSAFMLVYGTTAVLAQAQTPNQSDQQQMQSHPMGHDGEGTMGHHGEGVMGHDNEGMMGHGGMMDGAMTGRMMGRGMMGGGAMGSPFMMRMMFALMDADGDGTISLQEFQAAHERIFKAMDANKDGKLTPEEMHTFIHGAR
ncbi:MAG: EF-hand domain-containing protein [Bradyrhizobium sp.]|jgi:Ca2+-binding EF-hand superfamily protein|uniref:EF-hand domain-containing protein n=1 Tax=Bradyrhizobium sp. TaxID=376 RepID=UPI003C7D296F